MATRALDIVTPLHALGALQNALHLDKWYPCNPEQRELLQILRLYPEIDSITGLEAKASRFYEELNKFLEEHGFSIRLDPFDTRSIGVVSILDKLVKWLSGPGVKVTIRTADGPKPGFELPASDVNVYKVLPYFDSFLIELKTRSDDTLWLFVHPDTNLTGMQMIELSQRVMASPREIVRQYNSTYRGAQVPMIDFDVQPDLGWLIGLVGAAEKNVYEEYVVSQAVQQFKFRMDETGARVKVATGIVMRALSFDPGPFVIDRPFYGWWTQKGFDLPMAAFFADYDSFRQPSGSLEDL